MLSASVIASVLNVVVVPLTTKFLTVVSPFGSTVNTSFTFIPPSNDASPVVTVNVALLVIVVLPSVSTVKSSLVLIPPSKLDKPVTSKVVVTFTLSNVDRLLTSNVPVIAVPPATVSSIVASSYLSSTAPAGLKVADTLPDALLILAVLVLNCRLPVPVSSI